MVIKKNILVTGSDGQLGKSLQLVTKNNFKFNFFFCSKKKLNITNYDCLKNFIISNKISIIINCAAYTNVDLAQDNFNTANLINCVGVRYLSKLCSIHKIQLIHISTDFVFDGKKKSPYKENDIAYPINNYGLSKLRGEKEIFDFDLEKSIIIRTSWLYSKFGNNFVTKIIDKLNSNKPFSVVNDEIGSPTSSLDLAMAIMILLSKTTNKKPEIYHYSGKGYCSRYEFAKQIKKILKSDTVIKIESKINKESFRPKFTVLDNEKIMSKFGLENFDWKSSLKNMLNGNY